MSNVHVDEYSRRYENHLQAVAISLQEHIDGFVGRIPNVERVTARAKTPARFDEKSNRTNATGNPRYVSLIEFDREKARTETRNALGLGIGKVVLWVGQPHHDHSYRASPNSGRSAPG